MQHKSYHDITCFATKYIEGFKPGDHIVIQEKIDGANSSFQYDKEADTMCAFSRRKILTPEDTLRGFKGYVDKLDKNIFRHYENLRSFGEWLVKHTIPYPDDRYYKFYLFDLFDTKFHKYQSFETVAEMAEKWGLNIVPTFYDGPFISWEHVNEFIGRTAMGGEMGEGVVVKNMERLNDPNGRLPYYVKLVTADFKEKMLTKIREPLSLEEIAAVEREKELVASIVTFARIRKMLHNLVDEGIIPEDFQMEDMGTIAKNLGRRIYEDCVKEEPEIVNEVGNKFGKRAASEAMSLAKEIIIERQKAR